MLEDVTKRLESLGYVVTEADAWVLGFIISKVENHVLNQTNLSSIPVGLHESSVDNVCGEFLSGKKGSGKLTDFNIDGAVKKIQEGDTTVEFASSTPEQRLNSLITLLMTEGDYPSYRRIKW